MVYESEIIESVLTGRNIDADEAKVRQAYKDNLDNVVNNIKPNEFAIPTIICGITGKPCEYGGKCDTCIVALETMTRTSNDMEEREVDLLHFGRKNDKKNGIEYMTTPSGRVRRYENKAQMMAHMGFTPEDMAEAKPEDVIPVIESHSSIYQTVFSNVLKNSDKVYFAKKSIVFEKTGGSIIVFRTV